MKKSNKNNQKRKKENKPKKLKEVLEGKLTPKEMELLTSSFDTVGSIAVIEIVPGLQHKQKIIGDSILSMHKQITTVCRRDGDHIGTFRTQKLKVVAGNKTKETTHIESGCKLTLDVENCYFSVRSGTERLRVAKLIQDKFKKTGKKEDVLIMFSGIAPFVCSLAKNAKDSIKKITGIELNPVSHKYAKQNIIQNKLKNANVILGDVRKIVPNLGKENIAPKSNWRWSFLKHKLKENPGIVEFYMPKGDLESKFQMWRIKRVIKKLNSMDIKIMIHMPHYFNGFDISLSENPKSEQIKNSFECIKTLNWLTRTNNNVVGFIVHAFRNADKSDKGQKQEWLIKNLETLNEKRLLNNLYLENAPDTKSFGTKESIMNIIKNSPLKHMCFDFAHYMGMNKLTITDFKKLISSIDTYSHIVNKKYGTKEHCCGLQQGSLDFKKYAPLIDFGCVEVYSTNEKYAVEQLNDYSWFLKNKPGKKFDRIAMPLPRTAEEFLDTALVVAKKGTWVHLYGFLSEDEFDNYKKKIIMISSKMGYDVNMHGIVKCGQFSPRLYRICVDFEVL